MRSSLYETYPCFAGCAITWCNFSFDQPPGHMDSWLCFTQWISALGRFQQHAYLAAAQRRSLLPPQKEFEDDSPQHKSKIHIAWNLIFIVVAKSKM